MIHLSFSHVQFYSYSIMESPTTPLDIQISRLTLQGQDGLGADELVKRLSTLTLHEQNDPHDEEISEQIFKLTLREDSVTMDDDGVPAMPSPSVIPHPLTSVSLHDLIHDPKLADRQYQRLCNIDKNLNSRAKDVLFKLDSLASSDSTIDREVLYFMKEQDLWLREELSKAKIFQASQLFVIDLKNALIERLVTVIDMVDCYALILSNREANRLPESTRIYDTGKLN